MTITYFRKSGGFFGRFLWCGRLLCKFMYKWLFKRAWR